MTTIPPPVEDESYRRGRLDGEVAAALSQHEDHFARLNGSMQSMAATMREQADELHVLRMLVQGIADIGDSREKTVKETAAALKVADDQRRDASDTRHRPVAQTLAIVAAIVGVVGLIIAAYVASQVAS